MSKEKTKKTEPEKNEETKEQKTEDTAKADDAKAEKAQTPEEKLEAELKESKDRYLRLAAEYDNFRKRSAKEKESTFNDAKSTVFAELLPVLDNFERALAAENTELADFKKGVDMTYQQLVTVFSKFNIESFGEAKDKFDPNFHNAVMHVDDENFEDNTVCEVFQKGYKVGEKVLRPAMVKVAN